MPKAFILLIAQIMARLSRWTWSRPPLPLDVIKTTTAGSLLFDTKRAEQQREIHYTPQRQTRGEAMDEIRNG
jgi:hypothetical protein